MNEGDRVRVGRLKITGQSSGEPWNDKVSYAFMGIPCISDAWDMER